ncbi:MAG TPA: hypothetical protein VMP11_19215 [Verrucomicrobiae bacterium]|nr:hypothetical protein [Verrucomicrobiae bacterium]
MRFVLLPLIFLSYFGMLAVAASLYPDTYDWRYLSISKLLYPLTNPQFHYIAAFSVAVTGVLLAPFAGFIRRRLGNTSSCSAHVGSAMFFIGCMCLTLAGLIASHPQHGTPRFPQLHSTLARISVIGIGLGLVIFNVGATRGYFRRPFGRTPRLRGLLLSWNLLTAPIVLVTMTWGVIRLLVKRSTPAYHTIAATALWKVGFWEWIGSIVVFAFLVCAVWLLPEHDPQPTSAAPSQPPGG